MGFLNLKSDIDISIPKNTPKNDAITVDKNGNIINIPVNENNIVELLNNVSL